MTKKAELTGMRFGKLTALRPTGKRHKDNSILWLFQCDCGNIAERSGAMVARLFRDNSTTVRISDIQFILQERQWQIQSPPNKDGSLTVAVDPYYILTQPASLPDKKGQPKLTGYSISNLLVCMAQQIVAAKAPQLFPGTLRPMTGVEVTFEKGQFVLKFSKVAELLEEAVPVETPERTPAQIKDEIREKYIKHARSKGMATGASV